MRISKCGCIFWLALSACEPNNSRGDTRPNVECGSRDDDSETGPVGCWELDTAISSEEGLLIIRPEGDDSQARLYFFLDESLYYAVFDVRVVSSPDGLERESGTVELAFECVGGEQPCAELDFTLVCPYALDTMGQCTAPIDSGWAGYPFSWTRCRSGDCPMPPD